jgi:hypothetical protein
MPTYYCMTLNDASTDFERAPRQHVTVAVPPVPLVSMCHDQLTLPLLPTVWL